MCLCPIYTVCTQHSKSVVNMQQKARRIDHKMFLYIFNIFKKVKFCFTISWPMEHIRNLSTKQYLVAYRHIFSSLSWIINYGHQDKWVIFYARISTIHENLEDTLVGQWRVAYKLQSCNAFNEWTTNIRHANLCSCDVG